MTSDFVERHIGPTPADVNLMLKTLGASDLASFVESVIPENIRAQEKLALEPGDDEAVALGELQNIAKKNIVLKSLLGQGYYDCRTPSVIKRNVLENPSWYTAYTPYQPEIAQGRLEVLFNFQTMITELTAMPIANASLLDEATAAAEAMALCHRTLRGKRQVMLVSNDTHPQTIAVLNTRAEPLGIDIQVLSNDQLITELEANGSNVFAVLVQYPGSTGEIIDPTQMTAAAQSAGAMVVVAADLLALTLLSPPGDWGADIVVGSAQRFGVPMGFGGPHAAFMATSDKHKRNLPGRLIGESLTARGKPGYRLALQTREQHIRREKATSNICTAQALLAIMATLYACYHGPVGLIKIARRVRGHCGQLEAALKAGGIEIRNQSWFDTLHVTVPDAEAVQARAVAAGYNLRVVDAKSVSVSLDETTTGDDVAAIASVLLNKETVVGDDSQTEVRSANDRQPTFLSQACFHQYQSETEMMRYLRRLADKDIALDRAMIPLGSLHHEAQCSIGNGARDLA